MVFACKYFTRGSSLLAFVSQSASDKNLQYPYIIASRKITQYHHQPCSVKTPYFMHLYNFRTFLIWLFWILTLTNIFLFILSRFLPFCSQLVLPTIGSQTSPIVIYVHTYRQLYAYCRYIRKYQTMKFIYQYALLILCPEQKLNYFPFCFMLCTDQHK